MTGHCQQQSCRSVRAPESEWVCCFLIMIQDLRNSRSGLGFTGLLDYRTSSMSSTCLRGQAGTCIVRQLQRGLHAGQSSLAASCLLMFIDCARECTYAISLGLVRVQLHQA
jgi:hypothetical protein